MLPIRSVTGRVLIGTVLCAFGLIACATRKNTPEAGNERQQLEPATSALGGNGLDVNDVSFLFAQARTDPDIQDLLPLSAIGVGGTPLVPRSTFDQVIRAGMVGGRFFASNEKYESWRIVAMRWDPCSSSLNHAQISSRAELLDCKLELRLTAQPLRSVTNNPPSYDDFTMHLIYEPPENLKLQVMSDLAKELQALKAGSSVDTTGLPLDVHPTMKSEGLGGPYAAALKSIILKFMGGARLTSIAFMSSITNAPPWNFRAFSIRDAGRTVRGPVTALDSSTDASIDAESALRVINPSKETQFSASCRDCHRATARLADLPRFVGSPNFFNPPDGVTGYAAGRKILTFETWEFRNFGYFVRQPQISLRTVNESAAVADLVNRTLLNVSNPAPWRASCDRQALTECLIDGTARCLNAAGLGCR